MSDDDIKKALECCLIGECEGCPISKFSDCYETLKDEAMSLINRQQERIEELEIITGLANNRKNYRKFVDEVFCKQKGKELSEPDFDYIYQLYFEQQAENEKFQSLCTSKDVIINEQEAEIERLERNLSQCENGYSQELHLARCKLEELKNFCTSREEIVRELRAVNERLKAEIDDLKRDTVPKLQDSLNRANKYGIEADCENTILKAVIDDLKHEIRNLECEKGQLEGTVDFLVAEAKSEAIKEFAERLKEKVDPNWDNSVDVEDIDNLLAERAGEQNV